MIIRIVLETVPLLLKKNKHSKNLKILFWVKELKKCLGSICLSSMTVVLEKIWKLRGKVKIKIILSLWYRRKRWNLIRASYLRKFWRNRNKF